MDVLKPELVWINNRCYRLTPCHNLNNSISANIEHTSKGYVEEDLYSEDDDQLDREVIFKNENFESSLHVPSMFYSHIIGSKGLTKKRIESETNTRIIVPRPGTQGDIIVTGKSRNKVSSACRKIDLVVLASRCKIPSTHFVAVPLNSSTLKDSYIKFKNEILSNDELLNFNEDFFVKPERLHLTLTMLTLVDNEDRLIAAQILNECKETLIRSITQNYEAEIYIHIKGLEIMNDDPSAVHVLYAKVYSETLQCIADEIVELYSKSNLRQKRNDSVKLHATLIKSETPNNETYSTNKRPTFDARKILQCYENYDFGIQKLQEIHLCQRFTTGTDGFYEATTILKL